jgi:adenosylmethionine-8-amino-7-oxononanoate aminotransferase
MIPEEKDARHIWHPYSMQHAGDRNIFITHAKGSVLYDSEGKEYIDAISSWWVNLHGHAHPYISSRIAEQASQLEHVIFAGFTHAPAIHLAERLLGHLPANQKKMFFSDNGSTAVEVAIKMSLQYWHNIGAPRTKVIAFRDAYHGDTFGAMSVSGRGAFTDPFQTLLFDVIFMDAPVPGNEDSSQYQLSEILSREGDAVAAFIFEPLVMGTAGMRMYDAQWLDALISLCRRHGILCIADEVMTGFGRTGTFFASDRLKESPDIFCLSKGLTGGFMPMGVTSCTEAIHGAFVTDDKLKTFFHGHSYTGNPLACAAALASLDLLENEEASRNIRCIESSHLAFAEKMKSLSNVRNVRVTGTILALDIVTGKETSYFDDIRKELTAFFLSRGVLLRPLGNVVYVLPPYCITPDELGRVYDVIVEYVGNHGV